MIKIDIQPISSNNAWKGRRFKTPEYKNYERSLLFLLPKFKIGLPPYKISFEFGFSNVLCDIDNPCKQTQDILCKKYRFNDRDVYRLEVTKIIVPKGKEFVKFEITSI